MKGKISSKEKIANLAKQIYTRLVVTPNIESTCVECAKGAIKSAEVFYQVIEKELFKKENNGIQSKSN